MIDKEYTTDKMEEEQPVDVVSQTNNNNNQRMMDEDEDMTPVPIDDTAPMDTSDVTIPTTTEQTV